MNAQALIDMVLHDKIVIGEIESKSGMSITRVIGGWLYSLWSPNVNNTTFVPELSANVNGPHEPLEPQEPQVPIEPLIETPKETR